MKHEQFTKLLHRYVIGFTAATVLSFASYLIVAKRVFDSAYLAMAVLLGLAVVQLIVQLIYFLHLDIRGRSASRAWTLSFTVVMMLVIVIGSIWIMRNLEYHTGMSGEAMNEYMESQNRKGF